jgi:hypothetical protein
LLLKLNPLPKTNNKFLFLFVTIFRITFQFKHKTPVIKRNPIFIIILKSFDFEGQKPGAYKGFYIVVEVLTIKNKIPKLRFEKVLIFELFFATQEIFTESSNTVHFLQFPMYCAEIRGLEIRRFGNCRIAHAETLKFVMSKGQEFSVKF